MTLRLGDIDFYNYNLVDKDTGEIIDFVTYANDDIGEYDIFVRDIEGRVKVKEDGEGAKTTIIKRNVKLVRKRKI